VEISRDVVSHKNIIVSSFVRSVFHEPYKRIHILLYDILTFLFQPENI